jgi:hypothetical protein
MRGIIDIYSSTFINCWNRDMNVSLFTSDYADKILADLKRMESDASVSDAPLPSAHLTSA